MLYYPNETYEKIGYSTKFVCNECRNRVYASWDEENQAYNVDPCGICNTTYFDHGKEEGTERMKHRLKDLIE